jgi:hypothetical protein
MLIDHLKSALRWTRRKLAAGCDRVGRLVTGLCRLVTRAVRRFWAWATGLVRPAADPPLPIELPPPPSAPEGTPENERIDATAIRTAYYLQGLMKADKKPRAPRKSRAAKPVPAAG